MSISQKYGTQCKEQPVMMGEMPFFQESTTSNTPSSSSSFYRQIKRMKYACVIQCLTVSGIFLFLLADLIVKFVQTQGNAFLSGAFNAFLKREIVPLT